MAMLTTSIYIEPLSIIKINWPLRSVCVFRGVCRGWVMRVSEHSSAASNTDMSWGVGRRAGSATPNARQLKHWTSSLAMDFTVYAQIFFFYWILVGQARQRCALEWNANTRIFRISRQFPAVSCHRAGNERSASCHSLSGSRL